MRTVSGKNQGRNVLQGKKKKKTGEGLKSVKEHKCKYLTKRKKISRWLIWKGVRDQSQGGNVGVGVSGRRKITW